jgi:hypothetical protein
MAGFYCELSRPLVSVSLSLEQDEFHAFLLSYNLAQPPTPPLLPTKTPYRLPQKRKITR